MKAVLAGLLVCGAALTSAPRDALADCECRANGQTFKQGEVVCLKLPSGAQLARCEMVLNNSSWKKISDGCPQTAVEPEPPAQSHAKIDLHGVDGG